MNLFKIYFLCFFFALGAAELLGPESKKEATKQNEVDDKDDEIVEKEQPDDAEDVKNSLEDVNNYDVYSAYQFISKVVKSRRELKVEELHPNEAVISEKELEEMELALKWLQNKMKPESGLLQLEARLESEPEKLDEDPQELLNKLPELHEEEEPELSPELKEAKELYEDAVKKMEKRSPDLLGTILQIKKAAERGYEPAKIKLAWSYLFGEGVEHDIMKAKMIFDQLAEEGNADAHAGLGFLYATGIGVPVAQGRALIHYMVGALGESDFAQMALAYRYWSGATLPSSCPKALDLYMKVASKVASTVTLSGGPAIQRTRLADEAESGGALDSDLIEYYQLLAEKGDVQAQVGLGQLHFQGGRGVTLDIAKARHYFAQAAKTGNAVSNAFLGKIYLDGGDGIKPDNDTALRYFRKAAELNNPVGQSGLGTMYLQGRGVPKDTATAFKYFAMAANQGWVEGQLNLGFMYFGGIGVRRDFKQANKYFSLASQSGHVLALYHLGQLHAQGLGVLRSCTTAVELFKNVCERGRWSSQLMRAHATWRARDVDSAFLQYLALAERGLELAQTNAAYLLDEGEVQLFGTEERWKRALQLWGRAAAQSHAPARVKLGDYHYYGLGTPQDLEAAAHHYRIASEHLHSAQATFNLGYMHERGLGLVRDAHLAKRCYDLAADASPDARLPAALASARLAAAAALTSLADSPLAMIFLSGDSSLLSNWDLYLITALAGTLGLVVYLRRPAAV